MHGTTGERPIDRLPHEHLRPVAGIPSYRALILERRRVARDGYLSYAGSWYSVPAEHAGRDVWVRQTDERVIISAGDQVLVDHQLASGPHQRITDPVHITALTARRDRRLQLETATALARLPYRTSQLEGRRWRSGRWRCTRRWCEPDLRAGAVAPRALEAEAGGGADRSHRRTRQPGQKLATPSGFEGAYTTSPPQYV